MSQERLMLARAIVGLLVSCLWSSGATADDRVIRIMSYNVENLFDTVDNPNNRGDNTYLPKSQKNTAAHKTLCEQDFPDNDFYRKQCLELDWSGQTLSAKQKNLASVIDNFNGGNGPDILVMQEVENLNVVNLLANALRNGSSYVTRINTEQSPGRGINVALISKLQISGLPKSHKVEFSAEDQDCGDTRDILEVALKLPGGNTLVVFGLHFPSGNNPVKCRKAASERLNEIVAGRPKDAMLVALGDTNINCNPEDQAVIADVLRDQWLVPDEVNKGCRPPGSNFFQGKWSFLDLIMTSRSLAASSQEGAPWFADFGSFRTVISAPEVQIEADNSGRVKPKRFDAEAGSGTADHLPVAIDLIRRR